MNVSVNDSIDHDSAESSACTLDVDLQYGLLASETELASELPSQTQFSDWALQAYRVAFEHLKLPQANELTIRLVETAEMTELNHAYRGKNKPTNVLSFPFEMPADVEFSLLGDVIICHSVVQLEAKAEGKTVIQHYAHMVTHGVLHLCGYDHQCDDTATEMEALEAIALAHSDIPNPYVWAVKKTIERLHAHIN